MKLLLLIIVFLSGVVSAEIIHVPAEQPDIQSAINKATTGDTVLVSEGNYYENISFKGKAITVASMFLMDGDTAHISATVIDGSQASQAPVVTFNSSESEASVLSGFTITGGSGRELTSLAFGYPLVGGGGIFITSGATVSHNNIINSYLRI